MQLKSSGATGHTSGNNQPQRFTAITSQEILSADPSSSSRRRGRSEYPVTSQNYNQASMYTSKPSQVCNLTTKIYNNRDENNFFYTRPSLKRLSATQSQEIKSEIPGIYSRPSKNRYNASKELNVQESPRLHHKPQEVCDKKSECTPSLLIEGQSDMLKKELSLIKEILC